MKQRIVLFATALVISFTLTSWGDVGHSMISLRANLSFNNEMSEFNNWIFYLSEHSSDADWRKKDDPTEGPKHYIDIDSYDSFVSDGMIPQSLDSCVSAYGAGFVADNGYLPWATITMYDSVVACMKRKDWDNAKKYAADMGHYVADGHMPLHITKNYDGQLTGNKGIHFRYEITMIDKYQDQIIYTGTPAEEIPDVSQYVFNYIYRNYTYKDSIIIADNYGKEMGSGTTSDQYYMALWEKTEKLTIKMFSEASHAIAELLYTAWIEAGRPVSAIADAPASTNNNLSVSVSPNPVSGFAIINYYSSQNEPFTAAIYDSSGRMASGLYTMNSIPGQHSVLWNSEGHENGTYFFVLKNNELIKSEIILVSR